MSKGLVLEDAQEPMVYWSGEQVKWIGAFERHLSEIKSNMEPGEEREFAFHVYILCSILIPKDADCVFDLEAHEEHPAVGTFRIQITMGMQRWNEFRMGATSFMQETFRQMASNLEGKLDGFKLTQYKDHIAIHEGGGVLIKKKE